MNIQFSNELKTKQFYVYKITYQNGKPFYIGKGQNCRYKSHFKKNAKLFPFIKNKLKTQSLRVVIIKDNLTEEKAFKLERKLIKKYGRKYLCTGVLYNLTSGGQGPSGLIISKESRKQISESNKGKKKTKETRKNMSIAKQNMSEKTKRNMSESKKGNNYALGNKWSKESKIKISETLKGNKNGYGNKGRKQSEEHKRKRSESLKGKKWSKARRNASIKINKGDIL